MRHDLKIEPKTELIGIASEVVYMQKSYWCNASVRQLKLSVMRPRHWYPYDNLDRKNKVIVFFCGGGFAKQDINVWNAELAYFAKKGYACITAEYDCYPYTRWPEQLEECKAAVRYIRAHAAEWDLDTENMCAMGDSAGGYLAVAMATTNGMKEYDKGAYLEYSSDIQVAVPWWSCGDMPREGVNKFGMDTSGMIMCSEYITKDTPPMAFFLGSEDKFIPPEIGVITYNKLQEVGVESELYMIEGAGHADLLIMQDEVKDLMIEFMERFM